MLLLGLCLKGLLSQHLGISVEFHGADDGFWLEHVQQLFWSCDQCPCPKHTDAKALDKDV